MGIDPPYRLSAMACRIAQQRESFFLRPVVLHVLQALCRLFGRQTAAKNLAQDQQQVSWTFW
jgi:hypothetical protein